MRVWVGESLVSVQGMVFVSWLVLNPLSLLELIVFSL